MNDSSTYSTLASVQTLNEVLVGYRVRRQIGHGAMGIVFEAEQERLRRSVAIKVLPSSLALRTRTVKRFLREAAAMGQLSHENIVSVYEVGSIKNLHFFSMKFVDGPPLDRVLKAGPLAISDVVSIGVDVARALAHAHSHGVMHRDVKPGNLLRDGRRVVLTDFGLARPLDAEETGTMTESGDLVGTPLYMAPEQITGDAQKIDGRSDVWGLGVTLYELLTQRAPFPGPNAQGILNAILHKEPPLLRKLRDDVPRELEAVILKCLEKDTARRYSGAAALLADLEAVSEGRPVSVAVRRFYDPPLRWIRRHPLEAGLLGAGLLVAGLLGFAVHQRLDQTAAERDQATAAREEAEVVRDAAVEARTVARVRQELSEARIQWDEAQQLGSDELAQDAEARVGDLLASLEESQADPRLMAECIEVMTSWLHQKGEDRRALEFLDAILLKDDFELRQTVRAAGLVGLELYEQALLLHRDRARRHPTDPQPRLDAASVARRRAQAEAGPLAPATVPASRRHLVQGLTLLAEAADLAIQGGDEGMLVTVLIERARCLIDLDRYAIAVDDLTRAIDRDNERVEARALLRTAQRRIAESRSRVVPVSAPTPPSSLLSNAFPVDSEASEVIEELLPAFDREDLESAGRGLQSIYRGLQGLLRSAATIDEPARPGTQDTPPPGARSPDSGS